MLREIFADTKEPKRAVRAEESSERVLRASFGDVEHKLLRNFVEVSACTYLEMPGW